MKQKKVADLLQQDNGNWFQDSVVSSAPAIMGAFANLVVLFAEIRVFDVVYRLTGVWWKALGASFACAVPFLLWEIGWQYNHTTESWRKISLGMAGLAFVTSIILGVADYVGIVGAEWADFLLGAVVILTGVHTVVGFLYYYNDPNVARRRHKAQALGQMLDQEVNAQVAGQLLESGNNLLRVIKGLEGQYDPEDVESVLRILQGKKKSAPSGGGKNNTQSRQNPPAPDGRQSMRRPAFAETISNAPPAQHEFTLAELLKFLGKSADEAEVREMLDDNGLDTADRTWTALRSRFPQGLTRKNFNRLFDELTSPNARGG